MKKIIVVFLSLLLLTGCTVIDFSNTNTIDIINNALEKEIDLYNNVFEGYKFYIPRGLKVIDKNKYNCKILSNDDTFYLYTDVISYYYKTKKDFKVNGNKILSTQINYDGKFGYIQVSEVNDKYFVEFMYNYAKIESYIQKANLSESVLNMTYILSSIRYNDKVIETLIDENVLDYKEEKFDIFESKTENSNFLEALEKHEEYNGDEEFDDQDILDYEEIE